jgi:predicted N-acetyltransferase YhbS
MSKLFFYVPGRANLSGMNRENPHNRVVLKPISERPEHIPTLAKWFQEEWGHLNPEASVESRVRELKAKIDPMQLPLTIVACDGNELIGTYSLDLEDLSTRPHLSPWMASVFVHTAHRQNGIGTLLVKDALLRAKALGIDTLYLFTTDQAAWYGRLGWEKLEDMVYRGERITVMSIGLQS